MDIVDFLAKGGLLVIPILLCSVLALAIFLERMIYFSRMRSMGKGIEYKITKSIQKGETESAHELAKKSDSPMGRVLSQAMEIRDKDRETMEIVIAHAKDEEVRDLSRYIQSLATIGNIAPLLGLLGTVIGMIKAFMVIQEMGGKVNAAVLAGGIWEAMMTTALGLIVALLAMVAHSYLVSQIDRYEARLQNGAVIFVKAIAGRS